MTRSHTGRRLLSLLALAWALGLPLVAPGTIAQQRARLPARAKCTDPIAGLWRAHFYDAGRTEWSVFELTIKRVKGSQTRLEGTIANESWDAPPSQSEPGPCRGREHFRVLMDANGSFVADKVQFIGRNPRYTHRYCAVRPVTYYPDGFSGAVEQRLEEFQSIGDDGNSWRGVPVVFRRIRCTDGRAASAPDRIRRRRDPPANLQLPALGPRAQTNQGCQCG